MNRSLGYCLSMVGITAGFGLVSACDAVQPPLNLPAGNAGMGGSQSNTGGSDSQPTGGAGDTSSGGAAGGTGGEAVNVALDGGPDPSAASDAGLESEPINEEEI